MLAVAGEATNSPSLAPLQDFHEAGAADADLDLAPARAAVFDREQAVVDHGIGGDESDIRFLAADDVGFDAHADPQRRVVGQADPDAKRLGYGIAGRRDLLDGARQHLTGERVGAQQRLLADLNPGDILLVDVGDDP